MTDPTCAGLPVVGDLVARYAVIALSPSGRQWDVKLQRFRLDDCYYAMAAVDITRPVRIVDTKRGGELPIIRAWN